MIAVGEAFGRTFLQVILGKETASAKTWDTVSRSNNTFQRSLFNLPFLTGVVDEEILSGRPGETLSGDFLKQYLFGKRSWIKGDDIIAYSCRSGIIHLVALGHPAHTILGIGKNYFARLHIDELGINVLTAFAIVVPIAGVEIFAAR